MIGLILFQVIVFIGYIAVIWKRYGILPTISDSFYYMPEKYRTPVFLGIMWSIAIPTCFYGSELYFLSGACLCFVGAAAAFRQELTGTVHVIGAWGSIGFALLGLLVDGYPEPLVGTIVYALIATLFRMNNKTWWIEIWAFCYIELGLILRG